MRNLYQGIDKNMKKKTKNNVRNVQDVFKKCYEIIRVLYTVHQIIKIIKRMEVTADVTFSNAESYAL